MQVISILNTNAISKAITTIKAGEIVIYPTETCYGIGVDVSNKEAVSRLLAYKGDLHRQVSIAVESRKIAEKYVQINSIAENLYTNFLPGPITVISKSLGNTDSRLESASGTLGIRIPNFAFTLNFLSEFGQAITATSANTSGKKEPYSLADWQKYTTQVKQEMVSLFLDAGKLIDRPTSTVIDTTLNDPVVLRQGEIVLPSSASSFTSYSEAETRNFGKELLSRYLNVTTRFPLLIALEGELGAGKTQLSKGFGSLLQITETIASPTYTLMHEYPYTTPKYSGMFYHIDTWRLADLTEIESTLHFSSLLRPHNIIVMEWAGKAKSLLESHKNNTSILVIKIKELDVNTRQISYAFSTPEWN